MTKLVIGMVIGGLAVAAAVLISFILLMRNWGL